MFLSKFPRLHIKIRQVLIKKNLASPSKYEFALRQSFHLASHIKISSTPTFWVKNSREVIDTLVSCYYVIDNSSCYQWQFNMEDSADCDEFCHLIGYFF